MEYCEHKTFEARWQYFFNLVKTPRTFLKYYFVDFHLEYNPEPSRYKKESLRALLISLGFAILFGIYERLWAFTIFDEFFYENIQLHWALWWLETLIIAYFASNRRWDQVLMSLLLVISAEDITYWMVEWAVEKQFPFPAKNWWDREITSFRVLGNLGTETSFWPYVPRAYYILGTIIIVYYLMNQLGGPKYGQIADWVLFPFLIPFFTGFIIPNDITFIVVLIIISSLGYIWGISLLILEIKKRKLKGSS